MKTDTMNMNINRREFLTGLSASFAAIAFGNGSSSLDEISKCRNDIAYFVENHLPLNINGTKKTRILKNWPKEYLRHLASGKDAILCSYRRSGKTLLNLIYSAWLADLFPNRHVTFVSHGIRVSLENFISFADIVNSIPRQMNTFEKIDGKTFFFKNGSSVSLFDKNTDFRGRCPGNVLILDELPYYDERLTKEVLFQKAYGSMTNDFQFVASATPLKANDVFGNLFAETHKCEPENAFFVVKSDAIRSGLFRISGVAKN